MTAPFPYQSVAGAAQNPAEPKAAGLFANYAWIARLVTEIAGEQSLDLKKLFQLVVHCTRYRILYAELLALGSEAHDPLRGVFLMKGCAWDSLQAMAADLAAIEDKCETALTWIAANESDYEGGFATRVVVDGNETDVPVTKTKSGAVASFIADFASLFDAPPA